MERVFSHSLSQGTLSHYDKAYLTQVVTARTSLPQLEAENRVSATVEEAQQSADRNRKALAHLSLWLFVALLSGAFFASYAGTIGGKQRDHVVTECLHLSVSSTETSIIDGDQSMRSILLLLLGVPIPIVILIALFSH